MAKYDGTVFVPPMDVDALSQALVTVLNSNTKYDVPRELRWETIAESWKKTDSITYFYCSISKLLRNDFKKVQTSKREWFPFPFRRKEMD